MVSMVMKLQKKNTINLAERTMGSQRLRMMALGMKRRRHVAENGREIEGASMDCPSSSTPVSGILLPCSRHM